MTRLGLLATLLLALLIWAGCPLSESHKSVPVNQVQAAESEQLPVAPIHLEALPVRGGGVDRHTFATAPQTTSSQASPGPDEGPAEGQQPVVLKVLVLDGHGQPIPDARVQMFAGPYRSRRSKGQTENDGRLVFEFDAEARDHSALLIAEAVGPGLTSGRIELSAP